jgi:DNA adenine methylase
MTDKPAITALVPWFGSKRTLAPQIVQELGQHRWYGEPFLGSGAVLIAKPPSNCETVSDLHGDLTNLAMVIASNRWGDLKDRASRVLCAEALFDACKAVILPGDYASVPTSLRCVTEADVERAFAYFAASWIGRNGTAGTTRTNGHMAVRWNAGGGHGPKRYQTACEALAWFHERLKNVLILHRDGFDFLASVDDKPDAALYIDPPYFTDTRGSGRKRGNGGGSNYEYDFTEEDHARLAKELARFRHARVVVSYYDHPSLVDLYPGWTIRRLDAAKNLSLQSRRGATVAKAPEVLIINGPSYAPSEAPGLIL